MNDFITTLRWREMIHDITPSLELQLQKGMMTAYIGFDPTAASLHVGNLATIMLLKHFQLAGHKPIVLVGGATGMIGDPSFKATERKFLTEEELAYNQACIKKQLEQFLDFTPGPNAAELVNNIDWFEQISFLKFLREAGKHITINYMMAKDSVKRRLEDGISFTEFSYQLLQGYDFYHLYSTKGVRLQMGGADQWGNLTTGIELIRRKTGEEAFALTTPLLTKADGSKFGKSEQGNVWLDPAMTSPYEFYQFWLNCSDEEAIRLIRVFTLLSQEEIQQLTKAHAQAPHQRILQKAIAQELTTRIHSQAGYEQAMKASELLFGHATTADLLALSERDFDIIFRSIPEVQLASTHFHELQHALDLVALTGINCMFGSKAEVRRAIQEGSLSINKEKLVDPQHQPTRQLLQGKYLLVQRGKKHHYLIKVV
jgi:tyrosyl-tRNA synthetase